MSVFDNKFYFLLGDTWIGGQIDYTPDSYGSYQKALHFFLFFSLHNDYLIHLHLSIYLTTAI